MPNRVIREGFLDSDMIDRLSFASECFYHRLLLSCDDAGRFDGRPDVLRSRLYPLREQIRKSEIIKWTQECSAQTLLINYLVNGKPYLQVTKWRRCGKAETSRYPWVDGSHSIEYISTQTRDGPKEYVSSSLADAASLGDHLCTPSLWGSHGVKAATNTETETKTNTETESNTYTSARPKARGTLEELKSFALEIGMPESDGEERFYRWQGNGWKNKNQPILDWRSTMRSHKANGYLASQIASQKNGFNNAASRPSQFETKAERSLRLGRENAERLRNEEKTET